MTEQKYKVGDRVEIVGSSYHDAPGYEVGAIGTVVEVRSHGVSVKALGDDPMGYGDLFFYNEEVKSTEDESKAAETDEVTRDNPLPYEVWIGDRLIAAFRWEDLRNALIVEIRDNVQIYTKENFHG